VEVTHVFSVSQVVATLGLSLYVAGYGLGPMIWSPLSEVPYFGRNAVYLGTLCGFVFLNFGVVYAKNVGMLLAFRFLAGFFGGPILATGGASLADMYNPRKRAYPMAIYGAANVMGPVLGPLIGGFAVQYKSWKWPIWILIWLSGFCFIFLFFTFPETSAANILYRRTCRLRKLQRANGPKITCRPELETDKMTPSDGLKMILVEPFTLTLGEPILFCLNLYIALVYAVLYCWLESIPLAFYEVHGFSLGATGLCYLGIAIGALITLPPYFWYNHRYVEHRFNDNDELKPEVSEKAKNSSNPPCILMVVIDST
jgi:DHA1 family multidrug resistance protein-like MFS transporter